MCFSASQWFVIVYAYKYSQLLFCLIRQRRFNFFCVNQASVLSGIGNLKSVRFFNYSTITVLR